MKKRIQNIISNGLFSKSASVFGIKIGGILLFFGLTLFLTNNFDADVVGAYDFMRSILLVLGGICMLGTNESIIYYSGFLTAEKSYGSLQNVYLKMLAIITVVSASFAFLFILIPEHVINVFFEKPNAASILWRVICTLFFFAISLFNIDVIRALKKPLTSELYRNVFRHLAFFLLAIGIFFLNLSSYLIEAFMLSFLLLALWTSLQVLWFFLQIKEDNTHTISLKEVSKRSYPMALSTVSFFLMQTVDIIFLGKFEDFSTVAHYATAVKLATVTTLALISVNIILAPKMAELYTQNNKQELQKIIQQGIRFILVLSLPAILILGVFNTFFLGLFGIEYTSAAVALWILLVGQAVNIYCGSAPAYLNMTNRQKVLQRIMFIGLFVNIILNWILIPLYSMEGAAIATALSIFTWNLILVLYIYKKDTIVMTFKI